MRIVCYLTAAIVCCSCASSGPPALSQANGKIYELNWDMRIPELGDDVVPIPGTNHVPLQPRRQAVAKAESGFASAAMAQSPKSQPAVPAPTKPPEVPNTKPPPIAQAAATPTSPALGASRPAATPVAPMYIPSNPAPQLPRTAISSESAAMTTRIKLYFPNATRGKNGDCPNVYYVERDVFTVPTIGTSTMAELIKGPSDEERGMGYSSAFEDGTKFKSLKISNGLAEVRFDPDFKAAKGACSRNTLRMQIVATLQQFPEVKRVGITAGTTSWP